MNKYIKCPYCELNYIPKDEKCCMVCNSKNHSKLITDIESKNEQHLELKLKKYRAKKTLWTHSMPLGGIESRKDIRRF